MKISGGLFTTVRQLLQTMIAHFSFCFRKGRLVLYKSSVISSLSVVLLCLVVAITPLCEADDLTLLFEVF